MIPCRNGWRWLVLGLLFICSLRAEESARPAVIRLRNELISTESAAPSRVLAMAGAEEQSAVSGHFLIQFTHHLQPSWQETLRTQGVALVRFIPDDAFLVYLRQVHLADLRRMPFIQWVGAYKPEHRIHSKLLQWLRDDAETNHASISLLLSPLASKSTVADAIGQLESLQDRTTCSLGTILRGRVTRRHFAQLARSDAILWMEPGPRRRLSDEIASKIVAGSTELGFGTTPEPGQDSSVSPRAEQPQVGNAPGSLDLAHATTMQQLGYDGRGVTVAVVDSGLNNGDAETMHPDLVGRVDAFLHYGTLPDASDPNGHGTHVAGIVAGDGSTGETDASGALYGLGVAPRAHIVVQRVFDENGQDQLPGNAILTRDAVRAGALIGSNSWGDDVQGRYDLNAALVDALVRDADLDTSGEQPFLLGFSAGNAGPGRQTIDSPAVAKNVLAIGASENDRMDLGIYTEGDGAIADFSSRGPTEDGRIKPDLVAPGTWIASLQSAAAGDANAWAPISPNYQYEGGTSQAVPHVTGAAAVFVQYYRETQRGALPSPALVKAALINTATSLSPASDDPALPNATQGWGRVALTNLVNPARRFQFVDQATLLATGQSDERRVVVASSAQPLKITLVYTDVPGLPAALPALVNDLDLEVVAPDGKTYHGNQFSNGESQDGVALFDNINNVEAVHLRQPVPGAYVVRVSARNVVEDVHQRAGGIPKQDYALVISGDLPDRGVGVLVLDRSSYTAPAAIHLTLFDSDLAGQSTATALVRSTTQTAGEQVKLRASDSTGVFTGMVTTVTAPAVRDGQLQIRQGDTIDALYQDASPVGIRTAQAFANLTPPIIRDVTLTNRFGKEFVSWETDTPATTALSCLGDSTPAISLTNSVLVTQHQLALPNLTAGVTYQCYVGSTDAAGNSSIADNQGRLFSFIAVPTPAVLLVNAYTPDDPIAGTTPIPLSDYTVPLDQSGFSYAVWDLTQPGLPLPTLDDLGAFRTVIWRISDSYASKATLSSDQQAMLASYLAGGGSFFIASMDLLSRIGPVPFRTNVLQVGTFVPNVNHGLGQCPSCDEDHGVESVVGADYDELTGGLQASLDYSNYNSDVLASVGISADMSDTFEPTTAAHPIVFDQASAKVVGMRYPRTGRDSAGRVVFLSFPFDALPETNRIVLMRNALRFLAPDSSSLANIAFDRASYTIPDQVTVEVSVAGLSGQRQLNVQFYTSTTTNGVTVALSQTVRPGVFRGFVTVIPVSESSGPNRIRVQPGDRVWAEYLDLAATQVVRADADIDVTQPLISGVSVQSAYEEAVIAWTTSEPSDALVQFGESSFLGRTAYVADPAREHALALTGLQPDHPYFFQVVSRDAAGNTSVDDQGGKLYSFRTLKPLFAPWIDPLESASTNWTVTSEAGSDSVWSLGIPQNGRETEAHSPTHAWGSNLQGNPIANANTSLISPAVDLTGGHFATLRFWQSYDWSGDSGLESGKLLILTNAQPGAELELDQFQGATAGWQEAVYDLSSYVGQVIQLVWRYEFSTFDAPEDRPGWLLDDFSITLTNAPAGSIQVSNNLVQAAFRLTGPISRSGQGLNSAFTNAPPGQYIVEFADVPYYRTPPPQTNLLSEGILRFIGNYQLEDLNRNGIADGWELQYFGKLLTIDPTTTDSDSDGLSDYAEFLAGTDPTDSTSTVRLTGPIRLANGMSRLNWSTVPGHGYRLLTSSDARSWSALSAWIRAGSTQLSYTIPLLNSEPAFFRLEVVP